MSDSSPASALITPQWLFATPLWQLQAPPQLLRALPRIAAAVEADWRNGQIGAQHNRSNFLGGQSQRVLLRQCPYLADGDRSALITAIQSVAPLAQQFQIVTWMNCGLGQAHNSAHVHPGAELSGVLYVQVPEGSGPIIFRDPRPQAEMALLGLKLGSAGELLLPRHPVQPRTGDLLLFPSWLMHQVEPGQNSDQLRIALSFNINGLAGRA